MRQPQIQPIRQEINFLHGLEYACHGSATLGFASSKLSNVFLDLVSL